MNSRQQIIRANKAKADIADSLKRLAGMAGVQINLNPRIQRGPYAELCALELHAMNLQRITEGLYRRLERRPSKKDLTKINGIGDSKAKQILELFGEVSE